MIFLEKKRYIFIYLFGKIKINVLSLFQQKEIIT